MPMKQGFVPLVALPFLKGLGLGLGQEPVPGYQMHVFEHLFQP